jgi:hypothetical protein
MKNQKLSSPNRLTLSKEKVRDLRDLSLERLRHVAGGKSELREPCVRSHTAD